MEKKTMYGEQIKALKKAQEICRDSDCVDAVPFITQKIRWMQQNDVELPIRWNYA